MKLGEPFSVKNWQKETDPIYFCTKTKKDQFLVYESSNGDKYGDYMLYDTTNNGVLKLSIDDYLSSNEEFNTKLNKELNES